jgi:hypothetical protein
VVPLAVIGRDLGPQRAAEPVNPGLDFLDESREMLGETSKLR